MKIYHCPKIPILFCHTILCLLISFTGKAQFSGGNGSRNNPYEIATLTDLRTLSENPNVWDRHFILTNDINASDTRNWNVFGNEALGFSPIGDAPPTQGVRQQIPFSGSFNGLKHSISQLYVNRADDPNIGLFGYTENAEISNIELIDVNLRGRTQVGGLVGQAINSEVRTCYVTGRLRTLSTSASSIGGLIGLTSSTTLNSSYANTDVQNNGTGGTGGLIGFNIQSLVNNCYATGQTASMIDSLTSTGGLIGVNASSTVNTSYAMGRVVGNSNADKKFNTGGLIGANFSSRVRRCFYDTDVTDPSTGIGVDSSSQTVTGITTSDFNDRTRFNDAGWDFDDIWRIRTVSSIDAAPRPYLKMQFLDFEIDVTVLPASKANVRGASFYNLNDPVILRVQIPSPDYTFEGWQLNGSIVSRDNPYSFNCTGNARYTALLKETTSISFTGGIGTESDPYQITTIEQLNAIREVPTLLERHYVLTSDIDATETVNWDGGKGFEPIGYHNDIFDFLHFTGTINGNGHTISGLYINRPEENYVGLFRYSDKAFVTDLGFFDCTIVGKDTVGVLFAHHNGRSKSGLPGISNCYVSGAVSGNDYVGGLIGHSDDIYITKCYSTAEITGNKDVGGLIGHSKALGILNSFAQMTFCYAAGPVTGQEAFGALLGRSLNTSIQSSCYDFNTTLMEKGTGEGDVRDNIIGLSTKNFATPFFLRDQVGFDLTNDWQIAYSHDGYNRPCLKWETVHDVDIIVSGNGTVEGAGSRKVINRRGTGALRALAGDSHKFVAWKDAGDNTLAVENPSEFSDLISDTSFKAVFEARTGNQSLTFTVTGGTTPLENSTIRLGNDYYLTNTNGQVVIDPIENGTYSYVVTTDGYDEATGSVSINNADVNESITLQKVSNTTTFNVKNGSLPVANAKISLFNLAAPFSVIHRFTNVNGISSVNNLEGQYTYRIEAPGFADLESEFVMSSDDVVINVSMNVLNTLTFEIFGVTEEADTIPVPNAAIRLEGTDYITDINGEAIIDEMPAGTYSYLVSAEGFATISQSVQVIADTRDNVILPQQSGSVHQVTLNITNGQDPIINAIIIFDGLTLYADANGQVTVNAGDGRYTYSVFAEQYRSSGGSVAISGADTTEDIVLRPSSLTTVTFRVTDAISPINLATVTFDGIDYTTDNNGVVVIGNVLPGSYSLSATAPGFGVENSRINVSTDLQFNIRLTPPYTLTFNITDGANPIEGARITTNFDTYVSDVNGEVMINNLVSGTYRFNVNAPGFQVKPIDISIATSNVTESIILIPVIVSTITFNVTDGTDPVPDATITFDGNNYVTNSNGEATINGVISNGYRYTVTAPGFQQADRTMVVEDGDVIENIRLLKTDGPKYELTLRVTNGNRPISNAVITFEGVEYATDNRGRVVIPNLPGGTYNYTVSKTGFGTAGGMIEITNGDVTETITLGPPTYDLTFVVTDGTDRTPGAIVTFENNNYITDTEGVSIVTGIANGTYHYLVTATGFNDTNGTVEVMDDNLIETVTLNLITGVNEHLTHYITYYPNPVRNKLKIELSNHSQVSMIEICTLQGETLYQTNTIEGSVIEINFEDYPRGLLFMKMMNKEGTLFTKKIIRK
ncbi:T9SS type A sorting domain-containing protein [Fulvivirga sp. M361]|uniref:GLUG motif-containing protein n=1 Tax=Fulvivirga sp. M361 TaxID=2594266 RepID=UPI00117B6A89|nr:GLUG motif-containing protein [Fulvivirga sp. M361]TRX59130.1 T9SS type A sorting domain-containing protein [Fulvivirga sp. M361]